MRTRVKICGITRVKDLESAVQWGADAIGFNFYPGSPRYLPPKQAKRLLDALPPLMEAVAVVVGISQPEALQLLENNPGLTTVQWHGEAKNLFALPRRWIQAWSVAAATDLSALTDHLHQPHLMHSPPKALLLDAKVKGLHGGTGKVLPWELLQHWKSPHPILLAGGLVPENIAAAIHTVKPFGVDVASGVESAPGIKDLGKIKALMEAVKGVA